LRHCGQQPVTDGHQVASINTVPAAVDHGIIDFIGSGSGCTGEYEVRIAIAVQRNIGVTVATAGRTKIRWCANYRHSICIHNLAY
jgi:hypothetical protein